MCAFFLRSSIFIKKPSKKIIRVNDIQLEVDDETLIYGIGYSYQAICRKTSVCLESK